MMGISTQFFDASDGTSVQTTGTCYWVLTWTITTIWVDSAYDQSIFFSYFAQKIAFDISCKLSPKYNVLFRLLKSLTFTTLWVDSADDKLMLFIFYFILFIYFFYFPQKIDLDISYKSSPIQKKKFIEFFNVIKVYHHLGWFSRRSIIYWWLCFVIFPRNYRL